MKQVASSYIMIRPKYFNYNIETSENNFFQEKDENLTAKQIKTKSIKEFNSFVHKLEENHIDLHIYDDRDGIVTTDSVFPNNWFSLHDDGTVYIYPMFSENRRKEKRKDILNDLKQKGFIINKIIDLSYNEENKIFLEGTGSMVLDRENNICYAAISQRTNPNLVKDFCKKEKLLPITFQAFHNIKKSKKEIYHTNVIMNVSDKYSVICLESIKNKKEKNKVIETLEKTNKEIIEISESQCNNFAGNMLQIKNTKNELFLVMSKSAFDTLSKNQITTLLGYNKIIFSDLSIIEKLGGGSARCMIAENFLKKK